MECRDRPQRAEAYCSEGGASVDGYEKKERDETRNFSDYSVMRDGIAGGNLVSGYRRFFPDAFHTNFLWTALSQSQGL